MSKISTIHDLIVSKITSNLTAYTQLPNPYILEENTNLFLKKGFGIALGPGNRTDRVIGCQTSWQRTFNVILINIVTTTDHNTTARETIGKDLIEDHFILLKQFDKDADLSGNAIDGVVVADNGIELVEIDGVPHYVIEMEIIVEYLEDLT